MVFMKILFGADLVPTEMSEQAFLNKDFKALFGDIKNIVDEYDRFVVNVEFALTEEEGKVRKFGPCLKANPKCADAFKEFGVTDALLANNHTLDFGIKGLRDTCENLTRVGINYTGVGENDEDSRKLFYIEKDGVNEDALLETALEAGADDLVTDEEDVFEVRTQPNDVGTVSEALAAAGYVAISAEAEYIPSTYTRLDNPDDIKNMGKMLEMFEENDDVQNVWHNWEMNE